MQKANTAIEELFTTGASLIDNLDIYRSVEGNQLKYTNDLMRRSAELDSTCKSIKNMQNEISKVKKESDTMMNALRAVQSKLKS